MSAEEDVANNVDEVVKETEQTPSTTAETETGEVKIDLEKALHSGLSAQGWGSSHDMKAELLKDVDASTRELLSRVRKSVHFAKKTDPNLRLAHDDSSGMKAVDMGVLLNIIKDTELKQQVQKKVQESEKMVKDISSLLSSEGFL